MTRETILNVGFDDTDSPVGMCTTYLAYVIAGSLRSGGRGRAGAAEHAPGRAAFLDYPRLVRFNPNVPWKTRGNGAVSMRIRTTEPERVKDEITGAVFEHADIRNGANPGLVFLEGPAIPDGVAEFSRLALWQLISRADARRFVEANGLEYHYRGNGQGLVGAIGAIGYDWDRNDHTMELLSYRNPSMCGTPRTVSVASVRSMQEQTFPDTFSSFDDARGRVLITPRGPDPVFYGIRGENTRSLVTASQMIRSGEAPAGYMIFRTNQGTGAHLEHELAPDVIRPFASGWVSGTVTGSPITERGGHAFFEIVAVRSDARAVGAGGAATDAAGATSDAAPYRVRCAVYKPTRIAHVARNLMEGDVVRVGGGIRRASKNHQRVLNVEYIRIIDLADDTYLENPACAACGKNMKSKGVGQGYECARCEGQRAASKVVRTRPRPVHRGLYVPSVAAHRHLTRPVQRMSRRNRGAPFDDAAPWLRVFDGNSGE